MVFWFNVVELIDTTNLGHPAMKESTSKPKPAPKKKAPTKDDDGAKVSRFRVAYGRTPVSYVYGDEFPTCWLHSQQRQVF